MNDMELVVSESFYPLLEDRSRYLVLCGGAGSGKSEFAGRKVFLRCVKEGRHRFLIMRKVRKTLADSVVLVMRRILAENGVAHEYNKSDRKIEFAGPAGMNELVFEGLDDPEKIKSIKGITGIWIEEATEFSAEEFMKVDLRLREAGPSYQQIIMSFNPEEAQAPWLKKRFFDARDLNATVHNSTVDDNPIAAMRNEYRSQLDRLKDEDEAYWKVYRLGKWAAHRGRIYNWPVDHAFDRGANFDEVWYGGDFGYSVNEAGLVRIYRRARTVWLEEVIYRTGLTNQALGAEMVAKGIHPGTVQYWDSAEPKSIEELRRAGFNAVPADKGPDSVRARIDFCRSLDVRIVPDSPNLVEEANIYHWREDKKGNPLPEPVKFRNHLMDAAGYGIATHMMRGGAFFGVIEQDVYPL